jgi:hypothetical protein
MLAERGRPALRRPSLLDRAFQQGGHVLPVDFIMSPLAFAPTLHLRALAIHHRAILTAPKFGWRTGTPPNYRVTEAWGGSALRTLVSSGPRRGTLRHHNTYTKFQYRNLIEINVACVTIFRVPTFCGRPGCTKAVPAGRNATGRNSPGPRRPGCHPLRPLAPRRRLVHWLTVVIVFPEAYTAPARQKKKRERQVARAKVPMYVAHTTKRIG